MAMADEQISLPCTEPDQPRLSRAEEREFARLVLPLHTSLYGAALRYTKNEADAEDLLQDTMVRALRFWRSFIPGTSIKAWAFTILRNTFISTYHRDGRRRRDAEVVQSQMRADRSAALGYSESTPPGPDVADEAMDAEETAGDVEWALSMLGPENREAVVLRDRDGLTYGEIAEQTGAPIGTVMSRIYRGRRDLEPLLMETARDLGMRAEPLRSVG